MVKVLILKMEPQADGKSIFFNVLFEMDEGLAFISPGWKIFDERIFPPAKLWKGKYYSSSLASPALAKLVQAALLAQGFTDLDPDAWVSSKWGKAGLRAVTADDESALGLYSRYRGSE